VNNWKVIFATAVIFGAGVLTGGLLVNYVQHAAIVQSRKKPAPVRVNAGNGLAENNRPHLPANLSKQFLVKLDEALKLRPKQRETIRKILGDGQSQVCKVIQDSRLEIRKVLTPGQRREFDELIKRQVHRTIVITNTTEELPPSAPEMHTNPPEL
jgi:uncharacterized membrane protein